MKKKNLKLIASIASLFIGAVIFISKTTDIPFIGIDSEAYGKWSIGIYKLRDNDGSLELTSHPEAKNPVLTAKDITDRNALFVADPFLFYENNTYYMFFEVYSDKSYGDIGLATSQDGLNWKYQQIVLDEPFHLSYPYVIRWKDAFYMIPESSQDESIRLYKAEKFPYKWCFVKRLIDDRRFDDPTIFYFQKKLWLFVCTNHNSRLHLYYADDLEGPWFEHAKSPIIKGDKTKARPGGNVFFFKRKAVRIAQNDYHYYGNSVRAFRIINLDTENYKEKELKESPLLGPEEKGWNKDGMHHLSTCKINDKEWIVSVDGKIAKKRHRFYMEIPEMVVKFLVKLVN